MQFSEWMRSVLKIARNELGINTPDDLPDYQWLDAFYYGHSPSEAIQDSLEDMD